MFNHVILESATSDFESSDGQHWNARTSGTTNDLASIFGTSDGKLHLISVGIQQQRALKDIFQLPAELSGVSRLFPGQLSGVADQVGQTLQLRNAFQFRGIVTPGLVRTLQVRRMVKEGMSL
jgi:hypothetical protein